MFVIYIFIVIYIFPCYLWRFALVFYFVCLCHCRQFIL